MPAESSTRMRARASGADRNGRRQGWARRRDDVVGIAVNHLRAKVCKFLRRLRRAGMVRRDPPMLGCEAKGHRDVKGGKRVHLSIEPVPGVRTEAVGPGQAGSQIANAKPLHPRDGVIQTMILKVE